MQYMMITLEMERKKERKKDKKKERKKDKKKERKTPEANEKMKMSCSVQYMYALKKANQF